VIDKKISSLQDKKWKFGWKCDFEWSIV